MGSRIIPNSQDVLDTFIGGKPRKPKLQCEQITEGSKIEGTTFT